MVKQMLGQENNPDSLEVLLDGVEKSLSYDHSPEEVQRILDLGLINFGDRDVVATVAKAMLMTFAGFLSGGDGGNS